jgi:hypothetical protein
VRARASLCVICICKTSMVVVSSVCVCAREREGERENCEARTKNHECSKYKFEKKISKKNTKNLKRESLVFKVPIREEFGGSCVDFLIRYLMYVCMYVCMYIYIYIY